MNNIEKLKRVLTKELVEKNMGINAKVESIKIGQDKIKGAFDIRIATSVVSIDYVFYMREHGKIKLNTKFDLSELDNANDSSQEQDILAYIVYKHISSLETKIKQELD